MSNQQRPDKRCCLHCYFSRFTAEILHCLKNSPAVDENTGLALWPQVRKDDICGSFRFTDERGIDSGRWPGSYLPVYRDRFGDYCKIPLTKGKFAKVDPEDYIWLSQFKWHCMFRERTMYAVRTNTEGGKRERIMMHRLIADTPEHLVCDHINHDGLDNRMANLRNCTVAQNSANSRSSKNATSKYKGVSWNSERRKWVAFIKKDGTPFYLGAFDDETEAAKVYDKAAKKLNGEYANPNF